jgi:hypothetical protein
MYNLFTIWLFSYLDWRKGEGFGETWQRYKKKWKRARKGEKIMNLQFDNLQCTTYLLLGYLVIWIGARARVSEKRGKGTKKNGNV